MGLSLYEQECVILYNREEPHATVYTSDTNMMRRLKNNPAFEIIKTYRNCGEIVAYDFRVDKRYITIRTKLPSSTMTEEQKQAARERMKLLNERRSKEG